MKQLSKTSPRAVSYGRITAYDLALEKDDEGEKKE